MKKRIIAVVMMLVMVIACPFAVQSVSAEANYETLLTESGTVSNSTASHSFTNSSKRDVIIEIGVASRENVDVSLTNTETFEKIDKTITSSVWDYSTNYGYYYCDIEYASLAAGTYQVDVQSTDTFDYAIMAIAENKVMTINSSTATITAGQKKTLKVTDAPGKVTWKSSKTSVATVSSKGVVKAKKAGKVTITATSGNQKVSCKVTVKKNVYTSTKLTLNNINRYDVAGHAHKAYYKGGKIVCSFNIVNNTTRKVSQFKTITITVKTSGGATIAKQTFKNVKGTSMGSYSKKTKTLTIAKKNVKKKSADLRNAIVVIDGNYTYRF